MRHTRMEKLFVGMLTLLATASTGMSAVIMNDGFEASNTLAGNGWTTDANPWSLSTTGFGNPDNYIWGTGGSTVDEPGTLSGVVSKDTGYAIQSGDVIDLMFDMRDMQAPEFTGSILAKLYYVDGGNQVLGTVSIGDADIPEVQNSDWLSQYGSLQVSATAGSVGKNLFVSFEGNGGDGQSAQRLGIDNVVITTEAVVVVVDTDGDGIVDSIDSDDDNDGMPDVWETAHSLNPILDDAAEDPDLDNFSNWAEYVSDTDPQDSNSKQTSSVVQGPGANEMTIAFSSSSNRLYAVFYCDDLTEDNWLTFQEAITGTGSETNIVDSSGGDQRFYRIQVGLEGDDRSKVIKTPNYSVHISNPGFRLGITTSRGVALPADDSQGLSFMGQPAVSSELVSYEGNSNTLYRVTNAAAQTALVQIATQAHTVEITVSLENGLSGNIALSSASPGAAYGLADRGGYELNANLASTQKTFPMAQNGHAHRFISSFLIFPENGLAGACFDRGNGAVSIGPNAYRMENNAASEQRFHLYVGSMEEIYAAYRTTRIAEGYPGVAPKMDAFELGWESWDLLRWDTTDSACRDAVQGFLDRDYNIRWAVTGSGFWQDQGTTVSFGLYDFIKYPDSSSPLPPDFGDWTASKGIRWMIGQRINFIPTGGPYSSNPGESGATLFDTSPNSQEGLDNDYFIKNSSDQEVLLKSTAFPTVDCYLLDGNAPGAALWFKNLYDTWGVDGVKEDTMMAVPDHTIFNDPMRRIAEGGDFVMVRCAAYSSPGSLTRVNDTNGSSSMTRRTPINYLQYAASAAPNVYSDTVGFGGMRYVTSTMRHAWLLSLTAGMAVSDSPWNKEWSAENQAKLKKAIDFHYQHGPYMHSAAVDSHNTGYPHTMTPLPIAFPNDADTYNLASSTYQQFEWMIGPSLLATPLLHSDYGSSSQMNIYLPSGKWIDYETGQTYQGPVTLSNFTMALDKVPVFVGGKGVLIRRISDVLPLQAVVYPVANGGSTYTFNYPDGISTSTLVNNNAGWNTGTLQVTDTTAGISVSFDGDVTTGSIRFDLIPDHDYVLTGGE